MNNSNVTTCITVNSSINELMAKKRIYKCKCKYN